MERRLFVQAQRQIAIAARLAAEDKHVARTVHGLRSHIRSSTDAIFRMFSSITRFDQKHVLAVVRPVP
jgi:hypothetical protein